VNKTVNKNTANKNTANKNTANDNTATPLYALAGAGDLLVEKLREVSEDVTTRFGAFTDPKAVQAELTKRQAELAKQFEKGQADLTKRFEKRQAELSKRFETLTTDAKSVPAQLRELPALVQHQVDIVVGQFEATYEELAGRGKTVVTRIRKQAATEDLAAQAKSTATKAKATRTTTRKAASTATKSAKATTTSAKKTASSAAKAASDAAGKIGD
jgi:heparin binding hemagglutinin HbhA